MKRLILTLSVLLTTLVLNAQIGVLTLKKGVKTVPSNMWYTINEKSRKNQMYYSTGDEEIAGEVLRKVLFDIGVAVEDSSTESENGNSYWESELGNGYMCRVYFIIRKNNYTIAILSF